MAQSGEQKLQAEIGYDLRSYLDTTDRRPPESPWADQISEHSDPVKNMEMPFEDTSILLDGGKYAANTLAVVGLIGAINRSGRELPSFTTMIVPVGKLEGRELEDAVFVDEFVGADGVVRLPTTPEEMFDRLVA